MASPPRLALQGIALSFGGTPVLDGAELAVGEGERICLVGRNGSGKSTLLRIAAGEVEPDRGSRFVQPGATVRYLPQEPGFGGFATVLAYVEAGLAPGDDLHRARYLVEHLGLTGDENPARLSGGEARRAALARALAPDPDILLLDEPTNHLDLPAIEWLEAELRSMRAALVLVSHDRRFLETLSQATVWLDRGVTRRIERGFASFEAWRDAVLEEEERDRHKLDRRIAMEEDWLRYGVTARRKRNVRRLGRLRSLREARRSERRAEGVAVLAAGEAEASGRLVIEAKGIAKAFGGRPVIRSLDLRVLRGDRLGIVGPNGAGKTTLVRILTGELQPDAGTVRLGARLDIATLEQARASLDPAATLADTLTGGGSDQVMVLGQPRHVVAYMKDFLFRPEQARTPVGVLSGGERARLMLARALARPSNLLVLDEPTNDLDLETLDLLQEMLADYAGTVLLVSHDRDFLDRTVAATLAWEGDGRWLEYAGGYSDMLAQRAGRIAGSAPAPGRAERTARGAAPARGAAAGSAVPAQAAARRKLSFKEKFALETLPGEIDALARRIAALESEMAEPGFYGRDPAGFDRAATHLAEARNTLATAEHRWLELELLREELEG